MPFSDNTQTLSTFANWMKVKYGKATTDQFYYSKVLLDRFSRITERMLFGRSWTDFIQTARNPAIGPVGETDYLQAPHRPTINQATWTRKTNTARAKISDWLIAAAKGDAAAATALNFTIKDLQEGLSEEVNRQLYGDGTGLIVTCASKTTSTVTVKTESSKSGERGTTDLKVGQTVAVLATADGSIGNGVHTTVESIPTNSTVVLTAAVPGDISTASYGIYPASGAAGGTDYGYGDAMFGLGAVVSTTDPTHANYGGIDRDTSTFWKGVVNTDSSTTPSRPLSMDLLWSLYNSLKKNGAMTSLIVSDYEQWTNYGLLFNPSRRVDLGVKKLDGAWDMLEFAGIPWVPDKSCPPNTVFFLDTSTLFLREETPASFMDEDGSVLVRVGSGNTAELTYEMTMRYRAELCCIAPFRNGKIVNLTSAL